MDNRLNISEKEWNEIEAFLEGRLDEAGERRVQQQMHTDVVFRKKVETVQELSVGIEEAGLLEHLKATHKKAFAGIVSTATTTTARKVFSLKKWLVAASVLVAVVTGVFYLNSRNAVFKEFYRPDEGLPTYMGVTDNYIFDKAMVDYKTGEFQTAVGGWKQLLQQTPDSDTLNYFIGSALLADKKEKEAVRFFDKVIAIPCSAFIQEARWYKALALIKDGKKEDAVVLLQKTDHPGKAELLKKLE